jgi:hypothetical protein
MPGQFKGQFPRYNAGMQEPLENRPDGPPRVQDSPSKAEPVETTFPDRPPPARNRGWFQRGDRRINREGRPRGSKAGAAERGAPGDRAPRADRLRLLELPERHVAFRFTHLAAFWIRNAPEDLEIVGARVDAARGVVVFIVRSKEFPRVAKGAPIPEFKPNFDGLWWHKNAGRPPA